MKFLTIIIFCIIQVALPKSSFASTSSTNQFAANNCNASNLQACKSCQQLSTVTASLAPDDGDFYHGARWNGLYAAFVHNCLQVATSLLKRGANPNWGGWEGALALSVAHRWPHNDKSINRKWVALLLKYGARTKSKTHDQDRSAFEIVKSGDFEPDYWDLWNSIPD